MPIFRMTMRWTGFTGAPGYTNFHFLDPQDEPTLAQFDAAATRVRTFFGAHNTWIPAGVTIEYPAVMEKFNTGTGALEGEFPITALTNTVGTGTGNWSSATGLCINWGTSLVVNGRRLRGRTFMVPLANLSFDTTGTLSTTTLNGSLAAANALIAATTSLALAVWHKPDPGTTNGLAAQVASASIKDKTAVLRSRRD